MKIISLNTWGGRAGKERLLSFFEKHKKTVDIFCLQEMWSEPYENHQGTMAGGREIDHSQIMVHGVQEISALLSDHVGYFHPHYGDNYGLLMLVNKGLEVLKEGEVFVYKNKGYIPSGDIGNHARNIQYATIKSAYDIITVINFHGLWTGTGKGDTENRLKQSDNIIKFTKTLSNPYLIVGDFNLSLNTESVKKLENSGLTNLIREYGITSTRTKYYNKTTEKFADYVFVSKGIIVNDFKILPDEVSDHAAMFLDIAEV